MDDYDPSLEEEAREVRAMDEVQALLGQCFGFPVAMEAVADLRDANEPLWDEGLTEGFLATAVREALMGELSLLLVGRSVPTYGEARSESVEPDDFLLAVQLAHDSRYGEQAKPHWME